LLGYGAKSDIPQWGEAGLEIRKKKKRLSFANQRGGAGGGVAAVSVVRWNNGEVRALT